MHSGVVFLAGALVLSGRGELVAVESVLFLAAGRECGNEPMVQRKPLEGHSLTFRVT